MYPERSERGFNKATKASGGHGEAKSPTGSPVASQTASSISQATGDTTRSFKSASPAPPPSTAISSFSNPGNRVINIHSVLDPVKTNETTDSGRRRKAFQLGSPTSSNESLPALTAGTSAPTFDSYPSQCPGSQISALIEIASSGSLSVHREASLGRLDWALDTTSGTVQLPVDTYTASRIAHEERRRNAEASSRFRERRKEKEKETAKNIARLEQQVKALTDAYNIYRSENQYLTDAHDFYRGENQYLTNALRHIPGGERHFPRPPSPRRLLLEGVCQSQRCCIPVEYGRPEQNLFERLRRIQQHEAVARRFPAQ